LETESENAQALKKAAGHEATRATHFLQEMNLKLIFYCSGARQGGQKETWEEEGKLQQMLQHQINAACKGITTQ